jgi:ribose/xylose/arabinose/galactoside ABC-type transport system permease subunit
LQPSGPDATDTGSDGGSSARGLVGTFAARLRGNATRRRRSRDLAIWLLLLVEILAWTLLSPEFFSITNFTNVARQASLVGIVAVGMTFVMITAGIDLSVGSLTALGAILAAGVMTQMNNALLGVGVALGTGIASGVFAGVMITRFRVPPFIVTLAMLQMWAALTLLFNNGGPIPIKNDAFEWFGVGYIGPVPVPAVLMITVYAVGGLVLTSTKFGRRTYAVGANVAAAEYAGIAVNRQIRSVYIISGFLTGIGAILISGRLGTATPLAGQGLELDVIAATVIGGTSLFGGEGTLVGTLAGVLIIAFLRNGLTLIAVSQFWQQLVIGLVILLAVTVDRQLRSRA